MQVLLFQIFIAVCFVITHGHASLVLKTTSITARKNIRVLLSPNADNDEAKILREKAEQLRREVQSFEDAKRDQKRKYEQERQAVLKEKQEIRERYSAEVPILKSDGSVKMEKCDFPPRLKSSIVSTTTDNGSDENLNGAKKLSRIITVQANLPLGIVLGQNEDMPGFTTVDEVVSGGNGEAAGVKVGDLLRACTATQFSMDMPTWQLMAGGIGRPKITRMMFSTDGVPFEKVMEALVSNSMDPEGRPAWLVLERMDD